MSTKVWYVYMLHLSNNAYYTGITNDIPARMKVHMSGKGSKYVRSYLPFRLTFVKKIGGRGAATCEEIRIKKLGHFQKLVLQCQAYNEVEKWLK